MTSFSPTRLRSRSFLNNPPGYNPDVPSHSILLNSTDRPTDQGQGQGQGGHRAPSPHRSFSTTSSHASNSSHGYGTGTGTGYAHSETDSVATKATSGSASVSFAPLPVIPPELKRRSSITLGVAARKNLLSSPEDEIYPDPRRAGAGAGTGAGAGGAGRGKGNGSGVKAVYMNDQDWEEYKRQHDVKNGNDVVDIGELVTNQAKNLWRKVKTGTSPSPTTSTSSQLPPTPGSTSGKISSSPSSSTGTGSGIFNALTSPRMSMRRRSDPGQPPNDGPGTKEAATTTATGGRVPDLPDVEEESLSRYQSAEMKLGTDTNTGHHQHAHHQHAVSLPTEKHLGDINEDEKKPRYVAINTDTQQEVEVPPSALPSSSGKSQPRRQHSLSSPPPRVQDVLPSEDEIKEGHERELEDTLHEHPEEEEELDEQEDNEDDDNGYQGGVGTLGLENVEIKSGPGFDHLQDHQRDSQPSQHSQPSHNPHAQPQPHGQSGKHRGGHDTDVLGFDRSRFGAN